MGRGGLFRSFHVWLVGVSVKAKGRRSSQWVEVPSSRGTAVDAWPPNPIRGLGRHAEFYGRPGPQTVFKFVSSSVIMLTTEPVPAAGPMPHPSAGFPLMPPIHRSGRGPLPWRGFISGGLLHDSNAPPLFCPTLIQTPCPEDWNPVLPLLILCFILPQVLFP